jgi:carbamoyltransferase
MSVILGLHFGHDASAAVIEDGRLSAFVQRERLCRIKQAYSLDQTTLETAMDRAGVTARDIDVVAVTSTQGCDPVLYRLQEFSISYDAAMAVGRPALLLQTVGQDEEQIMKLCSPSMVQRVLGSPADPKTHPAFKHYLAEYKNIPFDRLRCFPWLETHTDVPQWNEPHGLQSLIALSIDACISDDRNQLGFHYPLRVSLNGVTLPGVKLDHHLAHAASSYFRSGSRRAIVLTNDGYGGRRTAFANGGVYLGLDNHLIALAPHYLTHGRLYDFVARALGFDPVGASGKLMGLAPYGVPDYFDRRFVGDPFDHDRNQVDGSARGWISFATERGRDFGHDDTRIIGNHLPFTEYQINFAASTQLLFEEHWLVLAANVGAMLGRQNISVDTLCLSGGSALNCPSNSRVCREGGFGRTFIEPNCDDGGLSIGAALWVYYSLMDNKAERLSPFSAKDAFTFGCSRHDILSAILKHEKSVEMYETKNPGKAAALDLQDGLTVAWYEAGSEMGPRALGHRSVLADPRPHSMHRRVNELKRREMWRPLAPAVLREHANNYFDFARLGHDSPFMLFTANVLDPTLAAITHVDGSARVQTVTEDCGLFHSVLTAFHQLTGVPILLNTSMNGPGQPIIETPDEAVEFLICSGVDVLYLDGLRIHKKVQVASTV